MWAGSAKHLSCPGVWFNRRMTPLSYGIIVALALLMGTAYVLTFFSPSFILGSSVYWTAPFGDRITNIIGAMYFARDEWRFPLFYVPALAFPEGANIVFTDSLPLLALILKIIYKF